MKLKSLSWDSLVYGYWRLFNAAMRVGGYFAIVVGAGVFVWLFQDRLSDGGIQRLMDLPPTEGGLEVLIILFPLIVCFLGYLIVRVRPYYPARFRRPANNS